MGSSPAVLAGSAGAALRRFGSSGAREQVIAGWDTARHSWRSRRASGTHSRWLGLPMSAHTIRREAMSAVAILASMVLALTSGAVRKARNANCSSIWPLVLAVEILPGQVAQHRARTGRTRARRADRAGIRGDGEVLGVVVAPIETGGAAEPFVLRAAPQPGVAGAQLVHGDLVVLGVADQPLVGVEAVVAGAETLDHLVDVAAVLDGHARAEGHRRALRR